MAWQEKFPGSDLSAMASSNVTAVVYNADQFGNLTYASGGIPQFSAVTVDTGTANPMDVILASSTAVIPVGIAQDWPAVGPGQPVRVQVLGQSKAVAAAAITVGQFVSVANASGQLGPAAAAGTSNSYIVGRAETAAAELGDLFTVTLMIGSATQVSS